MTDPYPYEASDSPDDPSRFAAFRRGPDDALGRSLRDLEGIMAVADVTIGRLPAMGLDEATRQAAARREQRTQAEELVDAARDRAYRDPLVAMRVNLAATAVDAAGLTVPLDEYARERLVARTAAAVALELVERDRDTAEAKLARVRDVYRRHLKDGPRATEAATVTALLTRLDEVRDAMADPA